MGNAVEDLSRIREQCIEELRSLNGKKIGSFIIEIDLEGLIAESHNVTLCDCFEHWKLRNGLI